MSQNNFLSLLFHPRKTVVLYHRSLRNSKKERIFHHQPQLKSDFSSFARPCSIIFVHQVCRDKTAFHTITSFSASSHSVLKYFETTKNFQSLNAIFMKRVPEASHTIAHLDSYAAAVKFFGL